MKFRFLARLGVLVLLLGAVAPGTARAEGGYGQVCPGPGGVYDRGARPHASGWVSGNIYTVAQDDTLHSIGLRFGLPSGQIAAANGIADPNRIYAGQRLTLDGAGPTHPWAPPHAYPCGPAPGHKPYDKMPYGYGTAPKKIPYGAAYAEVPADLAQAGSGAAPLYLLMLPYGSVITGSLQIIPYGEQVVVIPYGSADAQPAAAGGVQVVPYGSVPAPEQPQVVPYGSTPSAPAGPTAMPPQQPGVTGTPAPP